MGSKQDTIQAAIAGFQKAAVETGSWTPALKALAAATGANHGQLIGIGAEAAVPFNWVTDCPPEALEEFVAAGGGNPRNNPRVRAGLASPEMQVIGEADFATPEELRATPIYADLFTRYDLPFTLQTTLLNSPEMTIGLSALRSGRQGHANQDDRDAFAAIAPHVRAAVALRLALEHQGTGLIGGALETVSSAAFVLDALGRVAAVTQAAEALVSGKGCRLRLAAGRLLGFNPIDDALLAAFVGQILCGDRLAAPEPVVLRGDGPPLVLEALRLPAVEHGFGFAPAAIVTAKVGTPAERPMSAASAAFGLTPAEAAVGAALCRGLSPERIAADRRVSLDTVRSQIRALLIKTETRRQPELVALLGRYF